MAWCPNCKSEYREGIVQCPACLVPLTEHLPEETTASIAMDPVFLMLFGDQKELGMAKEILANNGVPYLCKVPGSGQYLQIVTGANMFGTELYVDRQFTHRAMRLLRQFDHDLDEPFDAQALDMEIDAYMDNYEPEPENHDTPATPEGYRIVWVFLAIFIALAVLAIALKF